MWHTHLRTLLLWKKNLKTKILKDLKFRFGFVHYGRSMKYVTLEREVWDFVTRYGLPVENRKNSVKRWGGGQNFGFLPYVFYERSLFNTKNCVIYIFNFWIVLHHYLLIGSSSCIMLKQQPRRMWKILSTIGVPIASGKTWYCMLTLRSPHPFQWRVWLIMHAQPRRALRNMKTSAKKWK